MPPTFRRSASIPKLLVLHRAVLAKRDTEQRHGFAVTRALRTIADVVGAQSTSRDLVVQALSEARQRGLITSREIIELRRKSQLPNWFDELLAGGPR